MISTAALALASLAAVGDLPDDLETRLEERLARVEEATSPPARIRARRRVAELAAGEPAPPASVTEALAEGLGDPSFEIRCAVVRLLLDGQEPGTAVTALVAALGDAEKDWKRLDRELAFLGTASYQDSRGRKDALAMEEFTWIPRWVEDALRSLGKLPDERAEKALLKFLRLKVGDTPGRFQVACSEALCDLGTQRAVEAVIEFAADLERAVAKGRTGPRYERKKKAGGPVLWDALAALVAPAGSDQVAAIEDAVRAAAAARGLQGPDDDADPKAWAAWWKEHGRAFAPKLGRLNAPVTAALPEREDS